MGRAVEFVEPEKREKREKRESRRERREKVARRGLSNLGIYMTNTDRFIYRSV